MRRTMLSFLMIIFTVPALGQTDGTYLLVSSTTVSPTTPTTTIGIWAMWIDPGVEWVFAIGEYDLTAANGVFSNPVDVLQGPASSTGVIAGNVISGARNGQLHIPPLGIIGSRDNPILLATYDWTTRDFTPRTVSLHTSNTANFFVALYSTGKVLLNLFPQEFSPGSGVINVIPAPAAWVVLALPLLASRRRRC